MDEHGRMGPDERLDRLENLALRSITLITVALLAVGAIMPFGYDSQGSYSVVTAASSIIGEQIESSDPDGPNLAIAVGFIGLSVCIVVAIVILLLMWTRDHGRVFAAAATILGVLMTIGAGVTAVFGLRSVDVPDGGPDWGLLFLGLGVLSYLAAIVEPVRGLWRAV